MTSRGSMRTDASGIGWIGIVRRSHTPRRHSRASGTLEKHLHTTMPSFPRKRESILPLLLLGLNARSNMESRLRGNDGGAFAKVPLARERRRLQSRVELGDQLVLEVGDHVLDPELAFLQALELKLVGALVGGQARDHVVEVAVLDL